MAAAMPMPAPAPEPWRKGGWGFNVTKGGGGTTGETEALSLDKYIASLVGDVHAEPLTNTLLAELLISSEVTELVGYLLSADFLLTQIANIFWSAFCNMILEEHDQSFDEALPFIVRYEVGGVPRFDLARFNRSIDEPTVRTIGGFFVTRPEVLPRFLENLVSPNGWQDEGRETPAIEERYSRFALGMLRKNAHNLKEAVLDYWKRQEPRWIQLPMPPVEPQASVAVQAVSVTHKPGGKVSTVGIAATDSVGRVGVTVAGHALTDAGIGVGGQVLVGGKQGMVISFDPVSDSGFVEIPEGIHFQTIPVVSRLQSVAPGANQTLTFSGLGTVAGTARVIGTPLTFTLTHPGLQRQLFTDYATLPGDSGCASFDPNGNLVGFCFGGSGTNSPAQFSVWIWSDSVFQAHKLY
jgi:hypothetical protein